MKVRSDMVLACSLLIAFAGASITSSAHAEGQGFQASAQAGTQDTTPTQTNAAAASSAAPGASPRTAVVLRFAVQSQPLTDAAVLSAQACPQASGAAPSPDTDSAGASQKPINVDPAILDKITDEMQNKLSKKMTVLVNPDPQSIPFGATVISGCITRASAGNSAARLVGMGLGASHLNVHVVVVSRVRDGWNPVDTFDIQVKGGSLLPPLGPVGLAVHAARDTQQTLSADAKKLAGKILKQLAKDMKAKEQATKNG